MSLRQLHMRKRMRTIVVAIVLLVLPMAGANPSSAATIRVTYTTSVDRVRPDPKNGIIGHHSLTITLSGKNTVQEIKDSRSGSSSHRSASNLTLGGGTDNEGGRWRVASATQLVRRSDNPNGSRIVTITMTGQTSCQATVNIVLKPGFAVHTMRRLVSREFAYYSRAEVVDAACEVQE
jgi:hypothetical protein